jgi:hypothetical protein
MAGRPGAVENSPYRKEIEEMLKEGKPDTDIAEWLKNKGKPISRVTINKYKNEKFNIPVEARKKYNEKKSKERLNNASNDVVSDIEKIDKFIEMVDPEIMGRMLEKDQAQAVNRFINTKYKILGVIDDKQSVEVNVNNNAFNNETQKQILDEGSDE